MKPPKRHKGESDLSWLFRQAMWLSSTERALQRSLASQEVRDGKIVIRRPVRYVAPK